MWARRVAFGNFLIAKCPLKISCASPVESNPTSCRYGGAYQIGAHGGIHVEQNGELPTRKVFANCSDCFQPGFLIESDKLNTIRAFQKLVFDCTDYPANAGVRERRLQRADDRKCMATVAYCGQAQYANCIRC